MPLSRLRLRLGVWFAVAFLAGLFLLDLSLYGYLRLQASRRLNREVRARAEALSAAVLQEYLELPDSGLAAAAREALREWQGPTGAYVVLDSALVRVAALGPVDWVEATRQPGAIAGEWDVALGEEKSFRAVMVFHPGSPRFSVVAMGSAHGVEEYNEALALWLTVSALLVLLLGLGGGYVLSRRALAPIGELEEAIAGISPGSLGARLPVNTPADEIDRVRMQFNALLDRLEAAQAQNRKFLREAAHQIRTPLTLVMGEASLELQRAEGDGAAVLRRIQLAAEQMQRRVDDLFLLAEVQAGTVPPLDETVELDGLLLEVADAMRGRAHQLGRQLRFREVATAAVRGNRGLLREALLELIENAVRHGTPDAPVELGLVVEGGVRVVVASGGGPFVLTEVTSSTPEHGLGIPIVQWIAGVHGGHLESRHAAGTNEVSLVIPLSSR